MIRIGWYRTIQAATFLALAILSGAQAQYPVQDMDRNSLGMSYTFALRGQNITTAQVASNEVAHQVGLGYAPVPYVSLQAGIGFERFSVAPHNQTRFRGDYGLTPSIGISAFSPFFAADFLRGTAGVNALFLASEDGHGYRYSALVSNPFLGLTVSPTVYLDVTVGGRLHLMEGKIKSPKSPDDLAFANSEIGRGYLAITLKTPFDKAFLNLDLDFSPAVDPDWSNGPQEAAIALSFGTILGWKGKSQPKPKDRNPTYFPAYNEMKEKQKKMAEELE